RPFGCTRNGLISSRWLFIRRACNEGCNEKREQLNDFSVFHVRSRTFNARRSKFNSSLAFRAYRSFTKAGFASRNQEAESKALEDPKRQARIGRGSGDYVLGCDAVALLFHAFESRAIAAETSG